MGIELSPVTESTSPLRTATGFETGLTAVPLEKRPVGTAPTSAERRKMGTLCLVLLGVVVVAWGILPFVLYPIGRPSAVVRSAPAGTPDGITLYSQHCATCHGERGNGSGPAAVGLLPRPRNFGEGKFRLRSTTEFAPTDDDLLRVIRLGIPGSAMPAFSALPENPHGVARGQELSDDEQRALVAHVRALIYGGIYERLLRKAEEDGDADLADIASQAQRQSQVGPVVEAPCEFTPPSPQSLANGKTLFLSVCAACHGPEGRGDGPQVAQLKNDDGAPTRPRDLTAGVFKGGRERERLYTRIMVGMPGTPMPAATQMNPSQIQDVVNYVLSLSEAKPDRELAAGITR